MRRVIRKKIVYAFFIGLLGVLVSSSFAEQERSLVVVTCSYNNAQWAERNLNSIFMQNYDNFRLIYVDDGSTDGTAELVATYINKHGLEDRVTLICNKKRKRKLANLYRALYLCKDHEIVVLVDGDDWLDHQSVFKRINRAYKNKNIWMTYGQYRNIPAKEARRWGFSEKGYCAPVPSRVKSRKSYRRHRFLFMHPRSFYAWLFKRVRLEDLIAESVKGFKGDFYPAANDLAIFYPIVEMAHRRVQFISNILYVRNLYSDIVGFKVDNDLQAASAKEIRMKKHYSTLKGCVRRKFSKFYSAKADVYIFVDQNLSHIAEQLRDIEKYMNNLGAMYVFYARTDEGRSDARELKEQFQYVCFVPYYQTGELTLKERLSACLKRGNNNYALLLTDQFAPTNSITIGSLIFWLEKTYAHAFYLSKNAQQNNVPRHVQLDNNTCAWKFMVGKDDWRKPDSLSMVLFRKSYLKKELSQLWFKSYEQFIEEIKSIRLYSKQVGLFFAAPKVGQRHS